MDLDSSWLAAAKYDAATSNLYIRFKDRKTGNFTVTCRYPSVPPDTYFALLKADSKGGFFHSSGLIKRRYEIVSGR